MSNRRCATVAMIAILLATPAFAQPAGGPPGGMGMPGMGGGPVQVGVITLQPETAPITSELPGRVVASATAEVRPQVGGVVMSVDVTEGQSVDAGATIATIDAASYEAELAVAQASVASAEAQLDTAEAKAGRYERLGDSGSISQADLDTARLELAQARATLATAEAQRTSAQLTRDRTRITAPIAGIVGDVSVQVGSLLTANQADPLTTIRQVDPVNITLVESSANLLAMRSRLGPPSADDAPPPNGPTVTLELEDGSTYDRQGSISTMNLVVSETTGTFSLQASMPNPDRLLLPGMFVRATISLGEQDNVFLVTQRAVTFDAEGRPTAYVVGADNKVEQRVLTAERVVNNAWVVTAGISAGDRLIVDGLQKISPGAEVTPLDVTIDADGVIKQEAPAMPPPGAAMPSGAPPGAMTPPAGGAAPQSAPAPANAPEAAGAAQ